MKILHVLYSGLGGHGNVFFSMVNADTSGEFIFEALFNGIEDVKPDYIAKCIDKNIAWSFVKKKPGLDIRYYFKLYRQIKKSSPEIIFLHGGAAAIPAWFAKLFTRKIKKIIVRETQANHLKTKIDWVYLATSMLVADEMVFLSEEYKKEVQKKLSLFYRDKRVHVIPNGIDLSIFSRAEKKMHVSPFLIGMQSRLIDIKDHLTLIKAFALLQQENLTVPIKLLIAGEGNYKEQLLKLTTHLNLSDKVFFTGLLNEKELVNFIQELDIYVHASFGETMSTAIMQAMACGKTIIASDVNGINNMIIDGVTGILVPVQNTEAMKKAILQLIENKPYSDTLSSEAFNFAFTNFSNKKMLQSYKALFIN